MPLPADILRPHLASVTYTPVKPLDVLALEIGIPENQLVKLDANENLYGPLPSVRAAIDGVDMHIYPDPSQHKLKHALSQLHSCSPDSLVVGAGSDEVLELVIKVVQCSAVVTCSPTFGMYKFLSNVLNVPFADVPRDASFNVDADAVIAKINELGRCIVYLASPNNPTGNCLSKHDFNRICATDCIVVLDEAYAEFSGASLYDAESPHDNAIFCRTFSKWAALAGMRVGYCIAHSTLVRTMMAVKQPYNIPVCSESAALAALAARAEIMEQVRAIVGEREAMVEQLKRFPFLQAFPSSANFVLFRVINFPAQELALALRSRGILVRFFGQQGGNLAEFIRISSARSCDTAGLLAALQDIHTQVAAIRALLQAQSYDTLIFDMDGVMVEVKGSYRASIIATCAHFGVTVSNDDISAFKARGNANNDWDVSLNLIKESGLLSTEQTPTREDVIRVFEELYQGTATKKGLKMNEKPLLDFSFFQSLKKKFKLAIVTGRPRKDCAEFLSLHSLTPLFDSIVTMDDAPLKPSPEPIHLAMRQAGGKHAIMFGDTKDDILSATSAGHIGVGVLPPGAMSLKQGLQDCGASAVFCAGMHELLMALHEAL